MDLLTLKKQYVFLEKKYKLPGFDEINADFEIDKIDKESDLLLRYIRKIMMEKVVNSINFLELLMNPVNSPKFYLAYIKNISVEDRKMIDEVYSSLGKITIETLSLEVEGPEKSEAEMVKKILSLWNVQKPKFKKILENMRKPGNSTTPTKERNYFG